MFIHKNIGLSLIFPKPFIMPNKSNYGQDNAQSEVATSRLVFITTLTTIYKTKAAYGRLHKRRTHRHFETHRNAHKIMNVLLNVVLIFAVVAVDSIASRATGSQSSDIILGPRSPHRVRIHSSMASGSQFRWSGENIISRIEIFRQFEHSSRAPQINIMDGLHSNRVHLFTSNGAPIDAWVSIYSVPRNMTLGTPAANAQRVHT